MNYCIGALRTLGGKTSYRIWTSVGFFPASCYLSPSTTQSNACLCSILKHISRQDGHEGEFSTRYTFISVDLTIVYTMSGLSKSLYNLQRCPPTKNSLLVRLYIAMSPDPVARLLKAGSQYLPHRAAPRYIKSTALPRRLPLG